MSPRPTLMFGAIAIAAAATLLLAPLTGCQSSKPQPQPHHNGQFGPPSMTGDDNMSAADPAHGQTAPAGQLAERERLPMLRPDMIRAPHWYAR